MKRTTFLALSGTIALAVALLAMLAPGALLASKGVAPLPATRLWVRELGVLLFALGMLDLAVCKHLPSPTLRAVLMINALVHVGLFPLELLAALGGIVPRVASILPNTILHAVLALGSAAYARGAGAPAEDR